LVSWIPPIVTDQNGEILSYNISVVDVQDNNSTSVLVVHYTNTTITGEVVVGTYSYYDVIDMCVKLNYT